MAIIGLAVTAAIGMLGAGIGLAVLCTGAIVLDTINGPRRPG
jgi:hypothetical protein